MEEFQNVNPWVCLKSIEIVTKMVYPSETITGECDPLFSCIITLSILILLYFPHRFSIIFSPVIVLTASLLLSLLRLGATQRIQTETIRKVSVSASVAEVKEDKEHEEEEKTESTASPKLKWATCKSDPDLVIQSFEERFVEWDVRAPLEVIYEGFEGDEEGNDPDLNLDQSQTRGIERYPSLSLYYPESDSDSSSDGEGMNLPAIGSWFSSEKMVYRWEDDEDKEGLIEISLDKRDLDFHGEDDNLIEINIS